MKVVLAAVSLLALLSACGTARPDTDKESSTPPGSETTAESSSEPTYNDALGTITAIHERHVSIDHDEIPGFMNAMTMSFEVNDPSLLQDLAPGMEVRFRIAVMDREVYIDQIERSERAGK